MSRERSGHNLSAGLHTIEYLRRTRSELEARALKHHEHRRAEDLYREERHDARATVISGTHVIVCRDSRD